MATLDFVRGLKCRLCGKLYPKDADQLLHRRLRPARSRLRLRRRSAERLSRAKIEQRPRNMWRYRELLPLDGEPTVGPQVGGTPLVRADRLADALGVEQLWIKNDAVNFPTLSFKDRVVVGGPVQGPRVRLHDRRLRLDRQPRQQRRRQRRRRRAGDATSSSPPTWSGPRSSAPASTGRRSIGVTGTYDEVNRLCTQVAFKYGWGFVNINLRPFYAEGSKTIGFEIAEELGWRFPQHVVCPMAGGSLIGKIHKAFTELHARRPGRRSRDDARCTAPRRPAATRSPTAVKNGRERHKPVRKPNTICKVAGHRRPGRRLLRRQADPRDRRLGRGRDRRRDRRGRWCCWPGPKASSPRRPAASTLAVATKLIEQGRIPRDEEIVLCITGNGLKTQDAVARRDRGAGGDQAVAGRVRALVGAAASRCWCRRSVEPSTS